MNLVVFISLIFFTSFGIYTCAVIPKLSPSPASVVEKLDNLAIDVGQEQGRSLPLNAEKKLNADDHAGDHDQDQKLNSSVKARKGVTMLDDDSGQVAKEGHMNRNISTDRASTTMTKGSESVTNGTSSVNSKYSDTGSSYASDKYSPYDSKSTKTGTSSSMHSNKQENTSASSVTSKSKSSTKYSSTESTSSKSSSFNKKPLITYSVEDDPTLLNLPIVRQVITPLTPLDAKAEAADSAYLPQSSDFVLDRMQSKREMFIFPLVVLIFLVPMVLGVGIIILRRVRDYMSTRHYRRMDFLVDGMYNS